LGRRGETYCKIAARGKVVVPGHIDVLVPCSQAILYLGTVPL
jgi:hypothetical protein